jgi:hypothetical protein
MGEEKSNRTVREERKGTFEKSLAVFLLWDWQGGSKKARI